MFCGQFNAPATPFRLSSSVQEAAQRSPIRHPLPRFVWSWVVYFAPPNHVQNGVSHASLSISPVEIKSYGSAECKRSKQDTYFTCKPNRFGKLVYEIAQGSTVMLHKRPTLVGFCCRIGAPARRWTANFCAP